MKPLMIRRIAATAALLTFLGSTLYAAPQHRDTEGFFKRLLRKMPRIIIVFDDGTLSIPPG
jgi:hypothetical protein